MGWPTADFIFAALETVRVIYAANQSEASYEGKPISRTSDIALGAGFLLLFVSSSVSGTTKVNECRDTLPVDNNPARNREIHEQARRIERQRQLRQQESGVQVPTPVVSPPATSIDVGVSPSPNAATPPAVAPPFSPPAPAPVRQVVDPE